MDLSNSVNKEFWSRKSIHYASETISPFKGHLAKDNEKRQGEGGGNKIGKMDRCPLWM